MYSFMQGSFGFDAMTFNGSEVHTRLQHLLVQLQIEAGVLDRIVYRNKNQHRHGSYFQYLLKVRRDLNLLHSTELGRILKMLFPIIDGKKPARMAIVPTRYFLKSNDIGSNHNLKNRLLGCARLLSQAYEQYDIFLYFLCSQISLLLAKSFFSGFCITVMALLARLRVLVQQMLQDVVMVFNKVSFLTTEKQSIKLSQDGVEVYREFHRSVHKRIVLECVWKGDKYFLLERTENKEDETREEDIQATPSSTTTIHYRTLELFDEEEETSCPPTDATNSSQAQVDKFPATTEAATGNVPVEPQTQSRRKVAFVSVKRPAAASNTNEPVKIPKLDLVSNNSLETDDPFLDLLFSGINSACATNK
ncbi:hypothetical protein ZIOFF_052014 [Zingiber officinale]|uniref:Nucleolus and neural progenitor protein-like N-terminal domain-containing protein n=1 Tax=Zingiber officinale TaxID=94328 RepID=A0A8J5G384_ZINOF|nr:hypothetical protein ZIOFF_052014 [Zingiber officinale]